MRTDRAEGTSMPKEKEDQGKACREFTLHVRGGCPIDSKDPHYSTVDRTPLTSRYKLKYSTTPVLPKSNA